MESNFTYYVFVIIAAIVVFFVLKKLTGCLLKAMITFIAVALVAAIYFIYIR